MECEHIDLVKMLNEYVKNPYNHSFCDFKDKNAEYSASACSCGLHAHIHEFLLWIKEREAKES